MVVCRQRSEEEANEIASVVDSLLGQRVVDRKGRERAMRLDDVLVVAPYNMHVNLLRARLPDGARVGTVDKFQGQAAEVVLRQHVVVDVDPDEGRLAGIEVPRAGRPIEARSPEEL